MSSTILIRNLNMIVSLLVHHGLSVIGFSSWSVVISTSVHWVFGINCQRWSSCFVLKLVVSLRKGLKTCLNLQPKSRDSYTSKKACVALNKKETTADISRRYHWFNSPRNDVWGPYFAWKPTVTLPNVGCFLRLAFVWQDDTCLRELSWLFWSSQYWSS